MKPTIPIPRDRRPAMARRAYELKRAGATRALIARMLDVHFNTVPRLVFSGRWLTTEREARG